MSYTGVLRMSLGKLPMGSLACGIWYQIQAQDFECVWKVVLKRECNFQVKVLV